MRKVKLSLAVLLCCNSFVFAQEQTEVQKLKEVVVTASGYEQRIDDAPATIEIIGQKDIEGKAYKNITNVLDDVSGVSIEGGSEGRFDSSSIYIRGLSEEYSLFLVDGKAQGSSQIYYKQIGLGQESSWLPPADAIERIEVIKGPMSSLYGSEAMGGVINVITKKVPNKASGKITYDTVLQENSDSGNSNQIRYYLTSPIIKDRLGITLYGSYFKRAEDDFEDGFKKEIKRNNSVKFNLKLNDVHDLELALGYAKGEHLGTEDKTGYMQMNNDRRNYSITHNAHWSDNVKTTSYITHENVHMDYPSNKLGALSSSYKRTTFNSKTDINFDTNVLTAGVDYRYEDVGHDESLYTGENGGDIDKWRAAAFLEDEYFLTDSLFITGGLRWDRDEYYGNEFIPRLYAVYLVNDNLSFKGGVSKGYKAPTPDQSDSGFGQIGGGSRAIEKGIPSIYVGNSDLKPETSTNYELSIAYNQNRFKSSITGYYTDFRDRIDRINVLCSSGDNIRRPAQLKCSFNGSMYNQIIQYDNVDRAELYGLELNLGYKFLKFDTKFNYTYSKSKYKSGEYKGEPFFNTPKHKANFNVSYQPIKSLRFWTKIKYKGRTQDEAAKNGDFHTPAYTIVDFGTIYKISKNIELFAGIYNLFDKEIDDEDYGKTLDGRRYNLGVSASF